MLKEAAEIVAKARNTGSDPTGALKASVFLRIASPLYFLRENEAMNASKGEPEKTDFPQTSPPSGSPQTSDIERKIKRLKECGYRQTENPDVWVLENATTSWFENIRTGEKKRNAKVSSGV